MRIAILKRQRGTLDSRDLEEIGHAGARLADEAHILRTNQAPSFPAVIATEFTQLGAVSGYLPLMAPEGISAVSIPIAISPAQLAVADFSPKGSDGTRTVWLTDSKGHRVSSAKFRFTQADTHRAETKFLASRGIKVPAAKASTGNLELQIALDSHHQKETITRQSLRRLVKSLIHDEDVELFLSPQGQDQSEMLRQLREVEAKLKRLNENQKCRGYYKISMGIHPPNAG